MGGNFKKLSELTPEQQAKRRANTKRTLERHGDKYRQRARERYAFDPVRWYKPVATLTPEQLAKRHASNYASYLRHRDKHTLYRVDRKRKRLEGAHRKVPTGFVYVLTDASRLIKIGYASDLWRRLHFYKTDNPTFQLLACIPGTLAYEKLLHLRYFRQQYKPRGRISRSEWFALTDDQVIELMQEFADASPDATIATVDADCYPSVRWRR